MFLDRIVATKIEEVEALKATFDLAKAEAAIASMPVTKGFAQALSAGGRNRPIGLIAEVKKASPSKGLIREHFEPVELAQQYAAAGADCLSVLTDKPYFQGDNSYLTRVRAAVDVPLLRKDFTIDVRQIYEARLIGADAVLLIAAILSSAQLSEYIDVAASIGLDALVEVHDDEELKRVLDVGKAQLIGVNNRDLRTFVTDIKTTERLIADVPEGVTFVSESGISQPAEIEYLLGIGTDAVLIGEHFMRQPDVGEAVHQLLGPLSQRGGAVEAAYVERSRLR